MNSPARTSELLTAGDTDLDPQSPRRDRRIGSILQDAGLVAPKDIDNILDYSLKKQQKFGESAVRLGLLRRGDLQQALAYQFDYPVMVPGDGTLRAEVVCAFESADPVAEDLRELRNQILLRWKAQGPPQSHSLAVISPERGDGRSFVAANLAVAFSQIGQRTLLIDADFRGGRQHELFGIPNQVGLSALLVGRSVSYAVQQFPALRDVSVLPTGGTPPNPLDLFAGEAFPDLLAIFSKVYDVVVVDTPAAQAGGEALMIAARSSGCLFVSRQGATGYEAVQRLTREIGATGGNILGSVMSEF